jgi:hypothetical protein
MLSFLAALPAQTASLSCPKPVVDLGEVRGGPQIEHSFTLVNQASSSISILETSGSCGCIAAKLSNRDVSSGGTVQLNLSIATISQPDGPNLWSVRVKYRTANSKEQVLELKLRATLTREVGVSPTAVQLIGGPGMQHEIVLTDVRTEPLKLNGIRSTSNRLLVRADGWVKDGSAWKCRIQAQIAENCTAGTWDEMIQVLGDEAGYRDIRIGVRLICRGPQRVQASPDMVQLRHEANKPSGSVLVLLRDVRGQAIEISGVECADSALQARFAEGSHMTGAVRLSVVPGKTPQPRSTVKVMIRKPTSETLTIPVEVAP